MVDTYRQRHGLEQQKGGVTIDPKPQIGIHEFADSSINIAYRIWVVTDRYFELLHACNLAVFRALTTNDVPIPFPQREVRILEAD